MRTATRTAKAKWGVNACSNDTTNTNLCSNEIAWGHGQPSQVKCEQPHTQQKKKKRKQNEEEMHAAMIQPILICMYGHIKQTD